MGLSEEAAALAALADFLAEEAGASPGEGRRALELVTVDEEGFPFPALLSGRQLVVGDGEVHALVRGLRPNRHLAATGRATLSFVQAGAYGTLLLQAAASAELPGGTATCWRCTVVAGSLDARADELEAIGYRAPALDLAEGPPLAELLGERGLGGFTFQRREAPG
ncbi:MAG TPA: hypothetical protein VFN50_08745 [Acidimicrobiales bacterium]|nr:hypothetical protein [Acidimicrobiales bacterium]